MKNDAIAKAVGVLGSQAALGLAVGVKRQAVYSWLWGNIGVPLKHCPSIEKATGGVVTCELLRPDFDWSIRRSSSVA